MDLDLATLHTIMRAFILGNAALLDPHLLSQVPAVQRELLETCVRVMQQAGGEAGRFLVAATTAGDPWAAPPA